VKQALLLIGGQSLARLVPLLVGLMLVQVYGSAIYARFVLDLSLANALIAVAVMGALPLVLKQGEVWRYARVAGGIWLLGALCLPLWVQHDVIFVLAYAAGYIALSLLTAQLNHQQQNARAGGLWLWVSMLALGSVAIGTALHLPVMFSLWGFALSWLLPSVFLLWRTRVEVPGAAWRDVLQTMRAGAFGAVFMLGFYALNHYVLAANPPAPVFAAAYQLFSLALFLPGVLGNLIIPRLARQGGAMPQWMRQLELWVLGLGAMACVLTHVLGEAILAAYHLPATTENLRIVLLLQISAVLAALNALSLQRWVAAGRFDALLLMSLIWAMVLFLALQQDGSRALAAAWGLVWAYLAAALFLRLGRDHG
jgi:hypothetical protein